MATAKRDDPYGGYNFIIEIDGVQRAGFSELSGITAENDVIDYREGAAPSLNVSKLPGLVKYGPVTLKRGFTQNHELWAWRRSIIEGNIQRRNIDVSLRNESQQVVLVWRFVEAWISKWNGPALNAKTSEAAIEQIEIVHEGVTFL